MQYAAKFPLALDPEPFYTCRTLHKTLNVISSYSRPAYGWQVVRKINCVRYTVDGVFRAALAQCL